MNPSSMVIAMDVFGGRRKLLICIGFLESVHHVHHSHGRVCACAGVCGRVCVPVRGCGWAHTRVRARECAGRSGRIEISLKNSSSYAVHQIRPLVFLVDGLTEEVSSGSD